MKALEFLEAAESQDEYAPSFSPSSLTPSSLETESPFSGLQWLLDNRLEYDALQEEYKELSNARLFYDISGPVSNYISRESENPFMGKPLSDVLVTANGYAIFWPKVFDRPSSRYIPQPINFSLSKGDLIHAWWDGDGFHCELIDS